MSSAAAIVFEEPVDFSISLPVRGQANFIRNALQSLAVQAVPMQLAVLDASPDNAVQSALADFQHIIHYQYHRPDDGQAAAIAAGWQHTSGDILAWLNADDCYYPDTLKRVRDVFLSNPDVDVVYGHATYVDAEGRFEAYFPNISANPGELIGSCPIAQPACFVRRSMVEKVGGLNIHLHYTMDWDLWVRLYKAGARFHFVDEPLAVVSIHPHTKTMSGSRQRYTELNAILREHAGWWQRQVALFKFKGSDWLYQANSRTSRWRWLLGRVLAHIRFARHALRPKHEHIKGIERWTNLVREGCEIRMPWYKTNRPRQLIVMTDKSAPLYAHCGEEFLKFNMQGECTVNSMGLMFTGFRHVAAVEFPDANEFSIFLESERRPWRLFSVQLQD
jgi:glycosyltransferase involved in cell wall biosynthesis